MAAALPFRVSFACLIILLAWERGSEAVTVDVELASGAAELEDTTILADISTGLLEPVSGKKGASPSTEEFPTRQAYQKYMAGVMQGMRRAVPKAYPSEEFVLGEAAGGDGEMSIRQVAFQKPTAQSSTQFGASSSRAVDGNTDTDFRHGSCTHTHNEQDPWWRVDLGNTRTINEVEVWNRGDCCGARLSNFEVRVGDSPKWKRNQKCGNKWTVTQGQSLKIDCTGTQGRFVSIVIPGEGKQLVLCEVKVKGSDFFGSNAALGKPTAQSSTDGAARASRAVDGRTTNNFAEKSCTKTKVDNEPWWHVDLETAQIVTAVQVFNRGDCCGERLSNAEVRVGDSATDWSKNTMCGGRFSVPQGKMKSIQCPQVLGRYVWVVIREKQTLTLCEVRVVTIDPKKGANLARGKPAQQSSTSQGGIATRAVDGNIDTIFSHGSCTHTHYDNEPWWRVDLESKQRVGGVQIWNRGDCCGARLSNFEVRVGMSQDWTNNKQCGNRHSVPQGRRKTIRCDNAEGRYVSVVIRGRSYLNLCEVRVLPADGFKDGCTSEALGVESHKITNKMMSASSTIDPQQHAASNARLNYRGQPWTAMYKKEGEWLQINLKALTTVTHIEVQGSAQSAEWVTNYKVKFYDGKAWQWYDESRVLNGANNQNNPQKVKLAKPFQALRVRLYPTSWHGAISMRVEVFGHTCKVEKKAADGTALVHTAPMCKGAGEEYKCVASKPTSLKINSLPGYGDGEAKIWYAKDKGAGEENIMGNSIYVDEKIDFRTQQGSIFSSKDLVAGRYVRLGAWPGYGSGTAQFRFSEKQVDGESTDESNSNSLFLDNANFHVKDGSVISDLNVRAGQFLEVGAKAGHGAGVAQLWYSGVANEKYTGDTLYLKAGNFKAETGSIVAEKNIVAGEYLEIQAMAHHGEGKARFWYAQEGKGSHNHKTVYLKDGNFRTETGSIYAKQDISAGRYLVLQSSGSNGDGSAKMWYAKDSKDGVQGNTVYLDGADLHVHDGSIRADQDVHSGRNVDIGAYPGFGSGSAQLWFSQVGTSEFKGNSLYLKGGDFRTQTGSIVSAQDVTASRYLAVEALPGHGTGKAELFYSETARGKYAATSLYLRKGDFRTESGSIVSGQDLEASRYLTVNAMNGFGTGKAQLWFCNAKQDGYQYNSLYLKSGDFRTEAGSIIASKDIVATESVKIRASPGYGDGEAKLWYSQTGRDQYQSDTVYLSHGDFRTQTGSIHAAKDLSAGRYLEIKAYPGHGSGVAQFWHGKVGERAEAAVYLKSGDFQTQSGSIVSSKDIKAGRYVEVGAKQGFGTGSAKLWYSRTGKGSIAANTLHLESGNFHAQTGSITASDNIKAGKTIAAKDLKVDYVAVKQSVEAGHLFLGSTSREESMLETTELLDTGAQSVNVGDKMYELDEQLRSLSDTNKELQNHLDVLLGKMSAMERNL